MQMTAHDDAMRIEAELAARDAQAESAHITALTIDTPEEFRIGLAALKELSAKHRELETKRKEATKPLDDAKKAIMAWFRPAVDSLDGAIRTLRFRLGQYEAHAAERERSAAEKYGKALAAGERPDPTVLAAAFSPAVELDGAQRRTVWKHRITDESKIPREYLCVDEKKIAAVVKALKSGTNIPGIEVYQDSIIAISHGADNE